MEEISDSRRLAAAPSAAGVAAAPRRPLAQAPLRVAGKTSAGSAVPNDTSRSRWFVFRMLGILTAINLAGLPYYMLPAGERMRSALHPWLKPTGYVGQTAGFLSMAIFLYLWLYPLRKKFRWLEFTGTLAGWLDVHVVAGILIPFLAAIHAAWHFTGLIGLGYGSMLVVCLSGFVGRYLYVRIPRSRSGLEMSLDEINAQRQALLQRIVAATGIGEEMVDKLLAADTVPYQGLGPVRTIVRMVLDDFRRSRSARRLRRRWKEASGGRAAANRAVFSEVLRLARREMALGQQVRMLDATHRVFRYWHVAHRPFAMTALVAVVLHVATAVTLGVTWVG